MAGEPDPDDWLEALRGRRQPDDLFERRAVEALRAQLRAGEAPGPPDEIGRQRLLQRLEREGLLPAQGPARPGLRAARPRRVLALAASLFAVAVGVNLWRGAERGVVDDAGPVQRGFAAVFVRDAPEPAPAAAALAADLQARGIAVRTTQRDPRMLLDFPLTEAQVATQRAWFAARGWRLAAPGDYRIVVAPPEPATPP